MSTLKFANHISRSNIDIFHLSFLKNLKNFLWITFFFYDCPLLGNIWAWFEKCHWVTLYRECGAGLDSQSRIHKQENATKELLAAAEALNSLFIYCLALCLSKLSYISFAVERLEHTSRFVLLNCYILHAS